MFFNPFILICEAVRVKEAKTVFVFLIPLLLVVIYIYLSLAVNTLHEKLVMEGKFDSHTLNIVQVCNVPADPNNPQQINNGQNSAQLDKC